MGSIRHSHFLSNTEELRTATDVSVSIVFVAVVVASTTEVSSLEAFSVAVGAVIVMSVAATAVVWLLSSRISEDDAVCPYR